MEPTWKESPGTPVLSAPSFPLAQGSHAPDDAHQSWRDKEACRISDAESYEHVDLVNSEISAESMPFFRSPATCINYPKRPSPSIDLESLLEASSRPLVDPDSRVPTEHPTPSGLHSPCWPKIPTERIPDLELGHSRKEPGPRSSSPSRVPQPPSPLPPRFDESSNAHRNGHPHMPSSMRPDAAALQIIPPRRSSRHYHPDRVDNESWPTGSTSYDISPFSTVPSQIFDSMIIDNPTANGNSRHFPPRLPTARPFSGTHNMANATRKTQSWIARHEASQIVRRRSSSGKEGSFHNDDSPSSSDESIASNDSFESEVGALWRELKKRQRRVEYFRNNLAQKLSELKFLRPKIYEADNAFMSGIRPIFLNRGSLRQVSLEQVEERLSALQRLQTEHQELEASYEELENIVDLEESKLQRVEVRFFSLLGSGRDAESVAPSVAPDNTTNSGKVPHELRGISSEKPVEELHPLSVQLIHAAARLRNGQEELSHLLNMKHRCDDTDRRRRKLGLTISKELNDFLADFPSYEASKKEEVSYNEDQVRRFTQLCEKKDVMPKHPSLEMTSMLNPKSEIEDIRLGDEASILSSRNTLAHPFFPLLLSQPDHLLEKPMPVMPAKALETVKNVPDDDARKQLKIQKAKKEYAIANLVGDRSQRGGPGESINR